MLKWLFRRRRDAVAPAPAPPEAAAVPATAPVDRLGALRERLHAACGDDAALLALAREAGVLEIKLAAVRSLQGEQALKVAEREFRRRDRRVHQLARQRLDAVLTERMTRARAGALVDAATALAAQPVLPLNRLAEIDRGWHALDAALLAPGQAQAFAAARAALEALLREREAQHSRDRGGRAAQARAAAPVAAPTSAAAPGDANPLAAPARPDAPEAAPGTEARPADSPAPAARPDAQDTTAPSPPTRRKPMPAPARAELLARIDALLQRIEDALAGGQVAPLAELFADIDAACDPAAPLDEARRARHQAALAEFARLRGWQQWSGARAVDTLVEEARALAAATAAADAQDSAASLDLDAHAATIRDLRARWKALERQRAPTGAAAWSRFDAAVQAAYAPVAVRNETMRRDRSDNLAARTALLDALDALPAQPPEGAGAAEHWKAQIRTLERFRADWRALGPLEQRVPREARAALRRRLRGSLERIEAPLAQARAQTAAARERLIEAALALAQAAAAPGGDPPRAALALARELQDEWARSARELPLARAVEAALWTRFRAAVDAIYAQRDAAARDSSG